MKHNLCFPIELAVKHGIQRPIDSEAYEFVEDPPREILLLGVGRSLSDFFRDGEMGLGWPDWSET